MLSTRALFRSTRLLVLLIGLMLAIPAHAQAPGQQGIPMAQLAQAANARGGNVSGAMREVVSTERQVANLARSGNASASSVTSAMRNRNSARQRFDLALVQLMQAQGDPQGIASATAGAQRQVQRYDQQLVGLNQRPDDASKDRMIQDALRARNQAQSRVNQYIQRWSALINANVLGDVRTQRQAITSRMDGALRELESYDRQAVENLNGSGGGAITDSLSDRITRLEQQIKNDEAALARIQHQGATKAAQDNNADRLRRQITQNKQELANMNKQLTQRQRQQSQSTARSQASTLDGRINALERFRVAMDQLLQFDARLQ